MKERCENTRYQAVLARMAGETKIAEDLERQARSMQFSIDQAELISDSRSWR